MLRGRDTAKLSVKVNSCEKWTYTETPSSLMIYPIPYPSAATGPKPNNLSAELPQLEVDMMEVLRIDQPWSVKMEGRDLACAPGSTLSSPLAFAAPSLVYPSVMACVLLGFGVPVGDECGEDSVISFWSRQYSA